MGIIVFKTNGIDRSPSQVRWWGQLLSFVNVMAKALPMPTQNKNRKHKGEQK